MKILDKYVYCSLLLSFFIAMATIWGFFVVIDTTQNIYKLKDYVAIQKETNPSATLISTMFVYYLRLAPSIIYLLIPFINLMAAMLTIVWMSRANELLILKAAGISAFRIVRSFIVFTLLMSSYGGTERNFYCVFK